MNISQIWVKLSLLLTFNSLICCFIVVGCASNRDATTQWEGSQSTSTGGADTITIDKIPWENKVNDDDWCQPVKEQKIGGVFIKCKGQCPSKSSPNCVLQKRRVGSEQDWKDVPDSMEVGDSNYEYRCICR
jgi:hypothetical protein